MSHILGAERWWRQVAVGRLQMWLITSKQRRDSQCNGIGLCRILSTGKTSVHLSRNPQGRKFSSITTGIFSRLAASQSPSKIWRAAAAGKIATRRLISRIILESVVNASSRRRRGLRCTVSNIEQFQRKNWSSLEEFAIFCFLIVSLSADDPI